jgi:hypothetical protein
VFAVFLGLSGGDGDAALEGEVDVVAGSFRGSIFFRFPASTFMYHGIDLEVNPFPYQGMNGIGGQITYIMESGL